MPDVSTKNSTPIGSSVMSQSITSRPYIVFTALIVFIWTLIIPFDMPLSKITPILLLLL